MIANILVIVVMSIVALLLFAAGKPDTFRVQRQASIKAAPDKLFAMINDLKGHLAWSPFEKDPAMKRTMSGPESGKGATYEWEGNKKVGAGRIQITDAAPPSKVTMRLEMYRPFKADNLVEFTVESKGETSDVVWTMSGRQPFMAKVVGTFINCDKMVGKEFETGLANLKAIAER